MKSWVYILLCADKSYYIGCTTNLEQRVSDHQTGKSKGYTSKRLPVKLIYSLEFNDIRYAADFERQLKGWTRKKKEAVINGDFHLLHELAECKNETHYKNKK